MTIFPLWGAYFWKRATRYGAIAGTVAGVGMNVTFLCLGGKAVVLFPQASLFNLNGFLVSVYCRGNRLLRCFIGHTPLGETEKKSLAPVLPPFAGQTRPVVMTASSPNLGTPGTPWRLSAMDRRNFFKAAAIPAAAVAATGGVPADGGESSSSGKTAAAGPPGAGSGNSAKDRKKTWLMFDWWHIEHQDNVALQQGEAQWLADATYEDPTLDYPRDVAQCLARRVHRQVANALLRVGLSAYPDGGRERRRPALQTDEPSRTSSRRERKSLQIISSPSNGPTVGRSTSIPLPCRRISLQAALHSTWRPGRETSRPRSKQLLPRNRQREKGAKAYIADAMVAVSCDGLNWKLDEQLRWGQPPWHPDPPINCFYDRRNARHVMVTRPGWGDRRVAIQISDDARRWRDLQVILQPDPLDPPQMQFLRHAGRGVRRCLCGPLVGGPFLQFAAPGPLQSTLGAGRLPTRLQQTTESTSIAVRDARWCGLVNRDSPTRALFIQPRSSTPRTSFASIRSRRLDLHQSIRQDPVSAQGYRARIVDRYSHAAQGRVHVP